MATRASGALKHFHALVVLMTNSLVNYAFVRRTADQQADTDARVRLLRTAIENDP